MFGESNADWREQRRSTARVQILAAAWDLARENGLAGMSLRDLGRRLGMATTSVYSYFDSKMALYDAMYADAWQAFIDFAPVVPNPDLRVFVRAGCHRWVRFSLADPVRFQLMSYRTIPGFEPTPDSFAVATRAYEESFQPMLDTGLVTQRDLDLLTGLTNGLIGQQLANDPGGKRWVRLVDEAADLVVDRIINRQAPAPDRKSGSTKERR